MFFFQFEVRPKKTNAERARLAGAIVNCWIQRTTQRDARAVANGTIGDAGWSITRTEAATEITRETQQPGGKQYFEQAENDGEVFVYHTWPVEAPDDIRRTEP